MKTDRELLELAAKAAGIEYDVEASKPHPKSGAWFGLWLVIHGEPNEFTRRRWNPLTDDGDALRLAVKLGLLIDVRYIHPAATRYNCVTYWPTPLKGVRIELGDLEPDPFAATRRAIVRAAAAIGETE